MRVRVHKRARVYVLGYIYIRECVFYTRENQNQNENIEPVLSARTLLRVFINIRMYLRDIHSCARARERQKRYMRWA